MHFLSFLFPESSSVFGLTRRDYWHWIESFICETASTNRWIQHIYYLLLFLWLFPSCTIAVWLLFFLLHIALSVSSPALSSVLFKSRWHASFHLVFGRPLFLFPDLFSTFSSVFVVHLSASHARTSSIVSPWSFWKPASLSLFLGCVRSWSCP